MEKNVKKGRKVKIIISANNNLKIGTITKIDLINNNNGYRTYTTEAQAGWWINEHDFVLAVQTKEELIESLSEIDSQIEELNKEKESINNKIKYLDETGSTEFDETEYKVYETLKLVNSQSTDLEKAKLIAALIKI